MEPEGSLPRLLPATCPCDLSCLQNYIVHEWKISVCRFDTNFRLKQVSNCTVVQIFGFGKSFWTLSALGLRNKSDFLTS